MERNRLNGDDTPQRHVTEILVGGEEEACVLLAAVCALHAALCGKREVWRDIMRAASKALDLDTVRRVHVLLHKATGDPDAADASSDANSN